MPESPTIRAVLWDFGGVITSSPFEAFARYEIVHGLPQGFIRAVNSVRPDENAWARLERSEISPAEFDAAFADESSILGHRVPGSDVLALLTGEVRPAMVGLVDDVVAAGLRTACLTNNVVGDAPRSAEVDAVMARFDVVVESSRVGVRKPERRFYELACEELDVGATQCLFLDDLGINLKPARALGMTTVKVVDPDEAIRQVRVMLGL